QQRVARVQQHTHVSQYAAAQVEARQVLQHGECERQVERSVLAQRLRPRRRADVRLDVRRLDLTQRSRSRNLQQLRAGIYTDIVQGVARPVETQRRPPIATAHVQYFYTVCQIRHNGFDVDAFGWARVGKHLRKAGVELAVDVQQPLHQVGIHSRGL